MTSLRTRLLLSTVLLLLLTTAFIGAVVDRSVQERAEVARDEKLRGLVYGLLGALDIDEKGDLIVTGVLPDPALSIPNSGIYAEIRRVTSPDNPYWRSDSLLHAVSGVPVVGVDEWRAVSLSMNGDVEESAGLLSAVVYGVRWGGAQDLSQDLSQDQSYTVWVAEDASRLANGMRALRRSLWLGLLGFSIALLVMLVALLRWGLKPLSLLSQQLNTLEQGGADQIEDSDGYPAELLPLVASINQLLREQTIRQARYRDSLGDLAHSLKTPLSVLRGMAGQDGVDAEKLGAQIQRMDEIVQYQLQRAATQGARHLSRRIDAVAVADRVAAAMTELFDQRAVTLSRQFPPQCLVRMDAGDLTEMLGNLLDNALKWSRSVVVIHLSADGPNLCLTVADDGSGFQAEATAALLSRGVRADDRVPGQGIGLAVVDEIVSAYSGTIELGRGELGGALVTIQLPVAGA